MGHETLVGPSSFVFFTSRLLGQFPYDSKGRLCILSAIITSLSCLVMSSGTVYLVFLTSYFDHDSSVLQRFLNKAELVFLQATGGWCCALALVNGAQFRRLASELDSIRILIRPLRPTPFPYILLHFIHFINLVWVLQAFFMELQSSYFTIKNITYTLSCHTAVITVYVMMAQYRGFLHILKVYTKSLREAITEAAGGEVHFQPELTLKLSKFQRAAYAYNLISKSCQRVDRMYGGQIFLTIALVSLILSENAYILNLNTSNLADGGSKLTFFKELIFWLTWWASIVWRIVDSSVSVQKEVSGILKST